MNHINLIHFKLTASNTFNVGGNTIGFRLKGRFVYVTVLMDVFSRMIREWQVSSPAFEHISDSEILRTGFTLQRPGDSSQRSRRSVSFKCLYLHPDPSWD